MTKHFFLGTGKFTIWYILFYLLGLPINLFGLFLFSQIRPGQGPQGGEMVLSIIAIGYLILGFLSLINTILYVHKTRRYISASIIFFGLQIIFWMVGYGLGNNYRALFFFFIFFLILTIYCNLRALYALQKHSITSSHHNLQNE